MEVRFKLGQVSAYYDKIGIAIVPLQNDITKTDKLRFEFNREVLFDQDVIFIQLGHEKIEAAQRGLTVGLKVLHPVPTGAEVFKISS